MHDGYAVDLSALETARDSLGRLVDGMERQPVSDLDAPRFAFGHAELANVTADFCDRWQRGVTDLLQDTRTVGRDLSDTIQTYREAEQHALDQLNQVGDTSGG